MRILDKSKLLDLIDRNSFTDGSLEENENLKHILKNMVDRLMDYNDTIMGDLQEKVFRDNQCQDREMSDIFSILIDRDKEDQYCDEDGSKSIFHCISKRLQNKKVYFLNTSYDEIKKITGLAGEEPVKFKGSMKNKNGEFHFSYYFKFNDGFIKEEKRLMALLKTHHIDIPSIYSPFSHKCFEIIDDLEEDCEKGEMNYCFQENGIAHMVLENKMLYWNLNLIQTPIMEPVSKKPFGETVKYKYIFDKDSYLGYICPSNSHTQIFEIEDHGDQMALWIDQEMTDFILISHKKVDMERTGLKELKAEGFLFSNQIHPTYYKLTRIRSKADIQYVVSSFGDHEDYAVEVLSKSEDLQILKRYTKKYASQLESPLRQMAIYTTYIRFTNRDHSRNKKFLEDYANYVLTYLDDCYPEIKWVGVY